MSETMSGLKGRGKPRDEALRESILKAAAEVLLEKGFKHFTMEGRRGPGRSQQGHHL